MIYFDNASSTSVSPEVYEVMQDYFLKNYGNPSSSHKFGQFNRNKISECRNKIAETFNCNPNEIYFTSGATESNNLAILGYCRHNKERGNHIITSKIEHHSVLNVFNQLEREGFIVDYVDVDNNGIVDVEQFEDFINDNTIFSSIMYVNNELGTIQPIEEIAEICAKHNICLHTDAVQAISKIKIDLQKLKVNMLSLTGHKINAPKGIGLLYIGSNTDICPLMFGGSQECGMRPGTESVPFIIGLSKAIEIANNNVEQKQEYIKSLQLYLENELMQISNMIINGYKDNRIYGITSVSFGKIDGKELLLWLCDDDIYVTTSAACNSCCVEKSHVLSATGLSEKYIYGVLRLSYNTNNTLEECKIVANKIKEYVNELRNKKD